MQLRQVMLKNNKMPLSMIYQYIYPLKAASISFS